MWKIKALDKISFDSLYIAFNKAFKDYEAQVNKEELQAMLKRRGFVPELSFGAFENNSLIAFTLNGIGMYNGINTAYDTGTGTIEEFRGKGIASNLFLESIPFLKSAGISQYLLEVLQHNKYAVSLYKKLGFLITREFNYFKQVNTNLLILNKELPQSISLEIISIDKLHNPTKFWDFSPSWQNSFESIQRCLKDFIIVGAFHNDKLVGYCIFEPNSGDITQIAVEKIYRRKGIGNSFLKELTKLNRYSSIKLINSEISCNALSSFMESNNIPLRGKQFEMIKKF